jgi:hypothetical protein
LSGCAARRKTAGAAGGGGTPLSPSRPGSARSRELGPSPRRTRRPARGCAGAQERWARSYTEATCCATAGRRIWRRAVSKLYEEPKKLVSHGLASASTEQNGRRTRTVYAITPEGRQALAAWLHDPGDGPVIEFEQLVKVFFAENGT